jgi:CcmD family protein
MPSLRLVIVLAVLVVMGAPLAVMARQPAPAPQSEFVPVNSVQAVEQLPAAPMLMTAYGIVWAVVFVYVWTIWRRQRKAELEIADITRRLKDR